MSFGQAKTLPGLLALRAAQAPSAEAVVDGVLRLTNAELQRRVRAVARALWRAGVRPGDRVATLAPPSADFWIALLATTSLGAIWQGLNPKYQHSEYRYLLGDARPKVVFVRSPYEERDYHAELKELAAVGTRLVRLDGTPLGEWHPFVREALDAPDSAPGEIDPEMPAVIVYTSGTTGQPKGALLSHRAIVQTALAHVRWIGTDALDAVLCPAPINHVGALNNVCMAVFAAGGRIVFIHKVDFELIGQATAQEKPSYLVGSPTAFAMMLALPGFDFAAFKGLYQVVVFGGAATPLPHLQALARSEARLSSVYGQTETTGMVTYTPFGAPLELVAETIGRPIEGMEIRVASTEGQVLPAGEIGEIQMRGISIMSGYFGKPEATREAFTADGWLKTGDLGRVRPDGEIAFAGRLKEMFKSGGYNCYPVEIELAICEHPDVAQAAVVAVPHEVFQEVGHAFVVPQAGHELRPEALAAFLRERMANYKVPKSWSIVPALSTLPNGKVDKRAMRAGSMAEQPRAAFRIDEAPGGAARPWLVLTHGAFGSLADFDGVVPLLTERYRVLRWDLPGHGAAAAEPPARRLEEAALALRDLLDRLGIERASVLGCSFGGMVAQRFAADHPQRCEALLACVCVPIFDTPMPAPRLLLALARLGWLAQRWPRWCAGFARQAASGPQAQARMVAQVRAHTPALRLAIWEAMVHGCEQRPVDRGFVMPAGLLTAEHDTRFPGAAEGYRRFKANLPGDRHLELAGVGHMAYVEAPERFASGVLTLLARLRDVS